MDKKRESFPSSIGPYTILRIIGRGGMGEVYLAMDPTCEREVALKRIKPAIRDKQLTRSRFLREARVASHLSHPSIIPIFGIYETDPDIYYTMPYVEGSTLRRILLVTRQQDQVGKPLHPIGKSIPTLTRIFLQICQAIGYTHSKGVLHRDIKPENIIIGKYGEVMLLDWGLANFIHEIHKEEEGPSAETRSQSCQTRPGKVAGTLSYMAPELLTGKKASIQTDIYALGVILYQMLTLKLPFYRKNLSTFRKQVHNEQLIDPIEMAPHRDIPHSLAFVATKCLSRDEKQRYRTVEELLSDLQVYIEGRPEWIFVSNLSLSRARDWQLQENVLLAKNIAITKTLDTTTWTAIQISSQSFSENVKIEALVKLKEQSEGVGFLFSVPETDVRKSLEDGYCLWVGSKKYPSHRLFRSNVQVLEAKGIYLEPNQFHQIRIEKIEDHIRLYVDDFLTLSFTSYLPLLGSHIGFLHKDELFKLQDLKIYSGSLNAMVNCLAVPNAFLTHRFFDLALQEYRRIAQCFPGRMEGRDALFRAGLTLLEKGKAEKNEEPFLLALQEFERLHKTPGAPLEYLGKSLAYEAMDDSEEEAKCLELGLRRFPKHPLIELLHDHIIFRMHESSLNNRDAAYRIILLAIKHIPNLLEATDARDLIRSLEENWEKLYFIEETSDPFNPIILQLCFWLKKIPMLVELGREIISQPTFSEALLGNILFALLELEAEKEIAQFPQVAHISRAFFSLDQEIPKPWTKQDSRLFYFLLKKALKNGSFDELSHCFEKLRKVAMTKEERLLFDSLEVWQYLLLKEPKKAESIFRKYPSSQLTSENSPLHFPFGAWLYLVKGPKLARTHFSSVIDTPYPTTFALPSYFLSGRINEEKGWIEHAFWWEKKELNRQLELFYRATKRN